MLTARGNSEFARLSAASTRAMQRGLRRKSLASAACRRRSSAAAVGSHQLRAPGEISEPNPYHARNRKFESTSLQRRVNKLSVPLEMMLVEGSIRRARTDWPSGGIARRNAHLHYFTYDSPPATRRRPEGFADAGTCTSQPTARAASQLHLSRRRADSPAPPSRQIKHRKRRAQLHGDISARIHYQHSNRLQSQTGWSPLSSIAVMPAIRR